MIDRLAGRGGGAERVLIDTANAMAARGHLVEILTHDRAEGPPAWPLAPGVMLSNLRPPRRGWRWLLDRLRGPLEYRLSDVPGLDRLVWTARHGGFWRRLARHLRTTRPDVAVAFLPPAITATAVAGDALRRAPAAGNVLRAPAAGNVLRHKGAEAPRLVGSTHNVPAQDFHNPERWDRGRLDRARRWQAMAGLDRITVLLEAYRAWYPPHLRARVSVLPNAVAPVPAAARARPEAARIVLAVGRLAPVKRHDLLIAAWGRIAARFPGWEVQIHGEGPQEDDLRAQIAALAPEARARLTLMGQTRDMAAAYRRAALLAHPATHEGFPLTVTEALAAGLPVLGFADCSGLNALVRDGQTGVLLEPAPAAKPDSGPDAGPASGPHPDTPPATQTTPQTTTQTDTEARIAALAAGLAGLMGDEARRARLGAAGPASMAPYDPAHVHALWEALLLDPLPASPPVLSPRPAPPS
ncbi:glycosyltransferase [Rhodobacteraceae bacterium 2376]|uniref:Glycosyltransferase n=1 Tax=Rhabdonatronobacter sediminivivens TaxID=2743469 RepID=A0A7Z0I2N1_9RHOB|nr:glycosyltransferase [Rhabdonatronobacter sediminivivens]